LSREEIINMGLRKIGLIDDKDKLTFKLSNKGLAIIKEVKK